MTDKIIDLRNRPAFLHDFFGASPGTVSHQTAQWLNKRVGSKDPLHFERSLTLEGYLEELDKAKVDLALVVGRETRDLTISNPEVFDLVQQSEKLIGFGSVDIQTRGEADTVAEINRAINQYQFYGINIEPAFGYPPLHVDDPLFYPVYEECIYHNVPVAIMTGPTSPDLDFAHPNAVARLAKRYPLLKIICFHGYYPFVNEVIGAAFRYDNIYLVPDMYIFQPGSQLYVDAANSFLGEQLLFGSSYPFRDLQQTINDFKQLGFYESALDKLFYQNAKRLLKLDFN
jgi:predicted TIM-barrel fold metal-dependent hydrolase